MSTIAVTNVKHPDSLVTNITLLSDGSVSGELGDILGLKVDEEAAWQDFTPTWTNVTVGNGTVVARYTQIGKIVYGYVSLTLGSTSSMGSGALINVPVTGSASIVDRLQVGNTALMDTGTATFTGVTSFRTGSPQTLTFGVTNTSGSYAGTAGVTSTVPFTWTTSDVLAMTFQYEAA